MKSTLKTAEKPKKGRGRPKKLPISTEPLFDTGFFKQFNTRTALAYWLAMPQNHKQPRTQKELAKILGVSEERLCQIKREDAFFDMVTEYRKEYFKQFTSNILEGCRREAEKGDAKNAKLFLQYVEDFKETTRQEQQRTDRKEFVMLIAPEKMEELQEFLNQEKKLMAKSRGYLEHKPIRDKDEKVSDTKS